MRVRRADDFGTDRLMIKFLSVSFLGPTPSDSYGKPLSLFSRHLEASQFSMAVPPAQDSVHRRALSPRQSIDEDSQKTAFPALPRTTAIPVADLHERPRLVDESFQRSKVVHIQGAQASDVLCAKPVVIG